MKEPCYDVPFLAVLGQDAKVLKTKCKIEWQEKNVPNLYLFIMILMPKLSSGVLELGSLGWCRKMRRWFELNAKKFQQLLHLRIKLQIKLCFIVKKWIKMKLC